MSSHPPARAGPSWLSRHLGAVPLKALAVGMLATIVLLGLISGNTWTVYRAFEEVSTRELQLERLVGTILHLDEVLTMSARMAAATGDARWEKRYRRFEPELDDAIRRATALAPSASVDAARKTEAANRDLVELEHQAFALVRKGRRQEAAALLQSVEYEGNKDAYAEGMADLTAAFHGHIERQVQVHGNRVFWSGTFAVLSALLVLLGWAAVAAGVRSHLVERDRDEERRRELEEQLRLDYQKLTRTSEELTRSNRDLDEFATMASHDLQEPLRKLVAFSAMLPEDLGTALPQDAERDLAFISDAARRMHKLVQDLLALSRTGTSALELREIDLNECVDQALGTLELRLRELNAKVERDLLPHVVADRTLVYQLYQNLIGNALKFVGEDVPRIHLTASRDDSGWILGVRDNGVGLPAEHATEIFEPFRRFHPRGTYEGTGVGLAICRKAVERHGGRIWVESQPGQGAHFKFTLSA